ncbi:MAG: hypothetical protein ACK6CT_02645 [Planctomycetia bacterium]
MSRQPAARVALHACCLACIGGLIAAFPVRAARAADEPIVLAVVACDPYAELKAQVDWLGSVVDQPALASLVESPLMMATRFQGLAGLDVNRPTGVNFTAEGPGNTPVMRGFVPVKNLDMLLRSLAPVIGDVVERDGIKTVTPAGMPALQIIDREGWAIIAARGTPDAPAGLEQHLDPVVKSCSLGARLFPSRLPEPLRDWIVTRAGEAAARQAQHPGAAPLVAGALKQQFAATEMVTLGLTLDVEKARAFLESRLLMSADSAAGRLADDMARAKPTAPTLMTTEGKPAAVVGHLAVAVPEPLCKQTLAVLPSPATAPNATLAAVIRELVPAMLDTGVIDTAFTIDTAAARAVTDPALPAITACVKVADGRAVEAGLKKAIGTAKGLPAGVRVTFDTGRVGAATLHTLEIDTADDARLRQMLGEQLLVTIGITPDRAIITLGPGGDTRAAALSTAAAATESKPYAGLELSLLPLIRHAATVQLAGLDAGSSARIEAVLKKAAAYPSSSLHLLVRPIEWGMAVRLSAEPGAIRLLKDVGTLEWEAGRGSARSGPVPSRPASPQQLNWIMRGILIDADANPRSGDNWLPTDIRAKDGTPLLSWRVRILQHINLQHVFMQFRLDEPWDSPHNIELLKNMPDFYLSPEAPADQPRHMTTYVGVQGDGLFLRPDGKRRPTADFRDGLGKTIAVVEVSPALAREWTKPDGDFPSEKEFLAAIAAWRKDGMFHAAFADGHVRELKGSDLTPADFRALLTVAGGDNPAEPEPPLRKPVDSGSVPKRRTESDDLQAIIKGVLKNADANPDRGDNWFPTDIRSKDGKPLLSWRVAILPHVGLKSLHSAFRLDEPWDSPHNIKLLKNAPDWCRSPAAPTGQPQHMTTYVGVQGEGLFLRPDGKARRQFGDFSDGPNRTIAVVEVSPALAREWTKPDGDFPTEKEFLAAVAAWRKDGTFHAAFADGHVRELKGSDLTPADFRALLTVAGGDNPAEPEP